MRQFPSPRGSCGRFDVLRVDVFVVNFHSLGMEPGHVCSSSAYLALVVDPGDLHDHL